MLDHTCKRAGMFLEHERGCENYLLSRVDKKWETVNGKEKNGNGSKPLFTQDLHMYFYYPFIFLFPFFISRCPFPVSFSLFPDPRLSNIYRWPVMKRAWQLIEKWE